MTIMPPVLWNMHSCATSIQPIAAIFRLDCRPRAGSVNSIQYGISLKPKYWVLLLWRRHFCFSVYGALDIIREYALSTSYTGTAVALYFTRLFRQSSFSKLLKNNQSSLIYLLGIFQNRHFSGISLKHAAVPIYTSFHKPLKSECS